MKFNFKKISAIGSTILLTGMSIAAPVAAAAYPAPFVSGGSANVAVVYGTGTGVSALDVVEAGNIQSNLQSKMGSSVGTTGSVSGEAASLASGSDLLYLLDDLATNVDSITKDNLPNVLADGDFVDDDGTSYEFEQSITPGDDTTNRFSFGNSDSDFGGPELMLELSTSTSTYIYKWVASFDQATNFTAADSLNQELTIFGKTYTIGSSTDGDSLILTGGSAAQKVYVGESITMAVDGIDYTVSLDGLSSADTTVASVTINGESKTFTQGGTKTYPIDGVDLEVNVKTVFRTGSDGSGHIEIILGADKLTLEDGKKVKFGSDNTGIKGTLVTLTPTPTSATALATGVGALTKIEIAVAAPDNDENSILVGEAFTDPVFGTVRLELNSVLNGPIFEAEEDTGRTALEMSVSSREIEVTMTNDAGTTKTIPFVYQGLMADDDSNPFVTVEGNNLTEDDYFILNSGDNEHLMQVSDADFSSVTGSIELLDVFTGTYHKLGDSTGVNFDDPGQNMTILSKVYTIINTTAGQDAAAGFTMTRAGAEASTNRALFPYMELIAGEDFPRVTFINATQSIDDYNGGDTITATVAGATGRTYELPTGTIQFKLYDANITSGELSAAANVSVIAAGVTATGASSATWTNLTGIGTTENATADVNHTTIKVGEAAYTFGLVSSTTGLPSGTAASTIVKNVTMDPTLTASTTDATALDTAPNSPMMMFVEDKDKSDSDAYNLVIFNTTDSGASGYSELENIDFSGTVHLEYDTDVWKDSSDSKLTGYLTSYGTYVLKDISDSDQHVARLTYGAAQMYADVYLAEESASITAGASASGASQIGDILVKDSEVSSVATKNLIVVGGSCINSAAASLVGGAYCGAGWTTATNVGMGEFLIKGYASPSVGKFALLVAGYDAADTVNAATYLRNQALDTSKEYKGTSSTSATLVTTEAA